MRSIIPPSMIEEKNPSRILVLVPHEPTLDPRVEWVTQLCAEAGRTDVLGLTNYSENHPRVEYDGRVYLERFITGHYCTRSINFLANFGYRLGQLKTAIRYLSRRSIELDRDFTALPADGDSEEVAPARAGLLRRMFRPLKRCARMVDHRIGGTMYFLSQALQLQQLVGAMWNRVRSISVRPDLIICHDLFALVSGIRLKQRFGCPVIYDCHEFWPEAHMFCPLWTSSLWGMYERRYARQADALVTVSPPLAEYLKNLYKLDRVLCVPNWTPWDPSAVTREIKVPSHPVRFLLQGNLVVGRGIEMLLNTWSRMNEPRAVLYIRCRKTEYVVQLQARYADAIQRGAMVFLDSVSEDQLVEAATFADVGVIPYPLNNKNHEFCCPNKFSQYLQAGLAVLSTETEYIGPEIRRAQCGLTYDSFSSAHLAEQVSALCDDLGQLHRYKQNAYRGGQTQYRWQAESQQYRELISEMLGSNSPGTVSISSLKKSA